MRAVGILAALVLGAAIADPAAAQLLSARSEALGPTMAGLFPDDWTDGLVSPALIPAGGLTFGRIEWSDPDGASRRAVIGGRVTFSPMAVLLAGGRALNPAPGEPTTEQAVLGFRYGRDDAFGGRVATYRAVQGDTERSGFAVAAGARTAAGRGWSAGFLAELAALDGHADGTTRYHAGEVLLRQPSPDQGASRFAWNHRLLRFRGGVGAGNFGGAAAGREDLLRWLEAAVVHLHTLAPWTTAASLAWGVRYTQFEIETTRCEVDCRTAVPVTHTRRGIAVDVGVEARIAGPVIARTGLTGALDGGTVDLYVPTHWPRAATLTPASLSEGIWLGIGWHVHGGLIADAAVGATSTHGAFVRTPLALQLTYRF